MGIIFLLILLHASGVIIIRTGAVHVKKGYEKDSDLFNIVSDIRFCYGAGCSSIKPVHV
jgi:hypothetical protein